MTKKRILTIGDVHGRDLWMDLTHESVYDYANWKISVEAGAPADCELWNDMPYTKYDKIIFVGDYVDSFTESNEMIMKNLLEILYFKRALPGKVVLLLGNHDVQYMIPNQICSGFRGEMAVDLEQIFRENRELFKIVHKEKNYLWSHAGITDKWLNKEAVPSLFRPDRKEFYRINVEYAKKPIDEMVNYLWLASKDVLFQVDRESGGHQMWAGPLWVRNMLNEYPLKDFNQVVGHTPCKKPWKHTWKHKGKIMTNHFIDCLEHYKEPFVLEI